MKCKRCGRFGAHTYYGELCFHCKVAVDIFDPYIKLGLVREDRKLLKQKEVEGESKANSDKSG